MRPQKTEGCDCVFISQGINRKPNSLAVRDNELIVACDKSISVINLKERKVIDSVYHSERVNCICHIGGKKSTQEIVYKHENDFIAGDASGIVKHWRKDDEGEYSCIELNPSESGAIASISTIVLKDGTVFLAVSTESGKLFVYVFKMEKNEWELVQETVLGQPHLLERVEFGKLETLPGQEFAPIVLAGSSVDRFIHVFVQDHEGKFQTGIRLPGHEDWTRSISFSSAFPLARWSPEDGVDAEDVEASSCVHLATACNDRRLRIFDFVMNYSDEDLSKSLQKPFTCDILSTGPGGIPVEGTTSIPLAVTLKAMLFGHEEWPNCVDWATPEKLEDGRWVQPRTLLSCSLDKSVVCWAPEEADGVWSPVLRLGATGGNSVILGQFGCVFGINNDELITHSWSGALQTFKKYEDGSWNSDRTVTGHVGPVWDVCWGHNYEYIVSVSSDSTVRCFAPLDFKNSKCQEWIEIARPLCHGYELRSCDMLPANAEHGIPAHRLFTGSDEKVVRVFDAPELFVHMLKNLQSESTEKLSEPRAYGAFLPELGLSAKAILMRPKVVPMGSTVRAVDGSLQETEMAEGVSQPTPEAPKPENGLQDPNAPLDNTGVGSNPLQVPVNIIPIEDDLVQNTIWPEQFKAYGHGNELVRIRAHPTLPIVASSCKARSVEHSHIILWHGATMRTLQTLPVHSSTVIDMDFSPDGEFFASVAKDRSLAFYSANKDSESEIPSYELLVHMKKAHKRMIWSCSWSSDSQYLATGSRDQFVKIFKRPNLDDPSALESFSLPKFNKPVTCISFVPMKNSDGLNMLAIGCEDGSMSIWAGKDTAESWTMIRDIDSCDCPNGEIKALKWKSFDGEDDTITYQLAIGSSEGVRVLSFDF